MDKYLDIINNLYKNILEINHVYPDIDPDFFNDFIIVMYNYVRNSTGTINEVIALEEEKSGETNEMLSSFQHEIKKEQNQFVKKSYELSDEVKFANNKLNEAITNRENSNKELIKKLKQEQLIIIRDVTNKVYGFMINKNQKSSHYELEKEKVADNYNNRKSIINKNNQNKIDSLYAKTNKSLFRYNKANNNILDNIENQISELEQKGEAIAVELKKIKSDLTEEQKKIDIKYNKIITNINMKNSQTKNANKNLYDLELKSYHDEIIEINETYQQNKSVILKEFINKLEAINKQIDDLTINHRKITEEKRKEFVEKSYRLDIEANYALEDVFELKLASLSTTLKKNYYEKKTLNKAYSSNYMNEKKEFEEKIKLYNTYKNNLETIKNLKNEQLNIKRDIRTKTINNKIDNLNYEYKSTNSIIELTYQNDVNNFQKESDLEKLDAKNAYLRKINILLKNKNDISKQIKILKSEINFTKEMEVMVETNEKSINNNSINASNSIALLEIEKNNYLQKLNLATIQSEINKLTATYNHDEQAAFYFRDRKNDLLPQNITSIIDGENHINTIEKYEQEIFATKKEKEKKLALLDYNYIYILKKNILDNNYANSQFDFIKQFIKLTNRLISEIKGIIENSIINSLPCISKNYKYILDLLISYIKDLCNACFDKIKTILSDNINFKTKEKYDSMNESLKASYEASLNKYQIKKNSIDTTIMNYTNAIKQFNQNIVNLENERINLEDIYKKGLITILQHQKKKTAIQIEIRSNYQKIYKNQKLISSFKRQNNKASININKLKSKYDHNTNILKERQENEAEGYYSTINKYNDLNKKLNNSIMSYYERINDLKVLSNHDITKAYYKEINQYLLHLISINNKNIVYLKQMIQKEYKEANIQANLSNLNNKKQIIKETNKSISEQYLKINEQNNKYASIVENNNKLINSIDSKYNDLIKLNEKNYHDHINTIYKEHHKSLFDFSQTILANQDNINMISRSTKKINSELSLNHSNALKNHIKKYSLEKQKFLNQTTNMNNRLLMTLKLLPTDHSNKAKNIISNYNELNNKNLLQISFLKKDLNNYKKINYDTIKRDKFNKLKRFINMSKQVVHLRNFQIKHENK